MRHPDELGGITNFIVITSLAFDVLPSSLPPLELSPNRILHWASVQSDKSKLNTRLLYMHGDKSHACILAPHVSSSGLVGASTPFHFIIDANFASALYTL